MKYKILEHTADIMFEVYGKTLNELFKNSAIAVIDVMVDRRSINVKKKKEVVLENDSVEDLLLSFLEEIVYIKDADYMIFKNVKVNVRGSVLKAVLEGDSIKHGKQKLKTDVKAVTLHKFYLKKVKEGYQAGFILDL